jgi:hypothetical protein
VTIIYCIDGREIPVKYEESHALLLANQYEKKYKVEREEENIKVYLEV